MLVQDERDFAAQTSFSRAGARVNSRVPISIEWQETNESHSASGWTVDIGPKGCMAIVPQRLGIGQKLRLTNRVNGRSVEAVLIWRGHESPSGWELGLELQAAGKEFWGLEF